MICVHPSIDHTIGNTPLVEIRRLHPGGAVRIYAKLESFNPGGSIKDRVAVQMIEAAERRGELTREKTIIEATSGNTGIGLALVAASRGYRLCLTLPESASEERKRILKALGAELIFTPANLGTDGAIEVAYNLMREHPDRYFGTDQYNNEDNVLAHYLGTGEEIWRQTGGAVTMVVAALGTSGTAMGVSRRLKEYNPAVRIVGVEPYRQHRIQGLKNMKESYRPGIFDRSRLDEQVNILDEDAFAMARRLAREEGLLVGMSSGAAMHVALEKARELDAGVIVVVFPDGGERYLSTDLFTERTETGLCLFNAMTREKGSFKPIRAGEVTMHTCGPTVHEIPHLGHFRRYAVADVLRRYLEHQGFRVRHILNVVDLDDRSIRGAEQANVDLAAFTQKGTVAFLEGLAKLNIRPDQAYPRASAHVDEMITFAERLVERGYAYEKLRSVYFDISKLVDYGRLSNVDARRRAGKRTVEQDDYEKESPADFALLKRSTLSELKRGIFFKSRWGNIRPSWHLECAAIAMAHLGETFDIHVGGVDVLFPHCENVLAIGRGLTGKVPANHWVNAELVMRGGKKMSRSLGNVVSLEALEGEGYSGREMRFFLLSVHYRKPLHFSPGAMETARNTVRKLDGFVQRLLHGPAGDGYGETDQLLYDLQQGFTGAMNDDLNISGALAALFAFVAGIAEPLSRGRLTMPERERIIKVLQGVDEVLGILDFTPRTLDPEAQGLLEARSRCRAQRQWAEADRLRKALSGLGVEVCDTPEGTRWYLR